jgi:glycosyltransferase involved in cell wall biosynthesis
VPIGIDSESLEFNRAARAKARAALGADGATLVIGNVARLVPFKGHRVLLDAAARVLEKVPHAIFPIVGDGELLQDLQEQAARLGISNRVMFLGFRDNLQELYPAFDVYCHSSLDLASEMFPIAILRALGTGLPVVATDVGGIALMVRQGISGYLVPPKNPPALADALLRVLGDPRLRHSMGEASASLFREKYHAAGMAEQIERVYTQL